MMLASGVGLVASDWAKERGVSDANPSFLAGAENLEAKAMAAKQAAKAPPVDISDIDPLAPRYKEWAERAAKIAVTEDEALRDAALRRRPAGPRRAPEGDQGHADLDLRRALAARSLATVIGTLLGAIAGFFGGKVDDLLEWFYNVFTSIPYILLILAFAAVAQAAGKSARESCRSC